MKLGNVSLPRVAWEWISFQWTHDVPFEARYLSMGFCLRRIYESVYDAPWEDFSPDGLGWEVANQAMDSYQMLYPMLVEEDFILGRTDDNPTARLGRHCKLGEVVEERFCVLTTMEHPMTFQSSLFDSGYISLLKGYIENKDGSPSQLLLFHIDEPDKVHCPVVIHDSLLCVGCRRPQKLCNCMFKLVIANNYSESALWRRAQREVRNNVPDDLALGQKNWLAYRSFHVNHSGISFFLSLQFKLGNSRNDNYVANWFSQYEIFNSEDRFERKLTNHVQKILGRSLLRMSDPRVPKLEDKTTEEDIDSLNNKPNVSVTGGKGGRRTGGNGGARKKHICHICGNVFSMKHHLQVHVSSVHEKRRDYACDQCSLSFVTEFKRQRHIRCVHAKERPYPCSRCNMSFFQRSDLTRHIVGKHKSVDCAASS